MSSSWHYNSYY